MHDKKISYLLRDIPPSLWRRAKHTAIDKDMTLRELLLKALEKQCAKTLHASAKKPPKG